MAHHASRPFPLTQNPSTSFTFCKEYRMFKTILLAAAALTSATAAHAVTELVTNGSFSAATISAGQKANFSGHVTGWGGGAALTYIDAPGTADDGSYLSVYKGFPATSPDGGNFVEADGDPSYRSAITQTISGLTVGSQYTLTFYQGAGQQVGFTGPTTERWSVSFGTDTQLSSLFSLPQGATGPWQAQTMTFTAHATSQLLSFLASGTPAGAPPISFLDGVSLTAAVPEPATWALMVGGFVMVGVAVRRRRPAFVAA